MGVPLSIRLDDEVRDILASEARARGVGLATFVRDLATRAARDARRARIRAQSAQVAHHLQGTEQGGALYDDVGTPTVDAG